MNQRVNTVGDLRYLLRNADDNTPLEIATIPDRNGWTNRLLMIKHEDSNRIVLALSEDCCHNEEIEFTFYTENVKEPVRPV